MFVSNVNLFYTNKNRYYKNLGVSGINFKGQLETDYFEASKTGNIRQQLKSISNLGFDVSERDLETQNNFLHIALKSKNRQLINKALIVLGQKEPSLIASIINEVNADGKKPYEYTTDAEIIARLESIANIRLPYVSENKEIQKGTQSESSKSVENYSANKLNELPEGTVITIPDDDEDEDAEITSTSTKTISENNQTD